MKSRQSKNIIPANSNHPSFLQKESNNIFLVRSEKPFFNASPIQAKLNVNQPNDPYEIEADSMADKVVQRSSVKPFSNGENSSKSFFTKSFTPVQRKCSGCKQEEKIQKKSNSFPQTASANIENSLNSSKGSGSPLPHNTREQMESSFGADFSNVRIHNDSSAVQMNKDLYAQAFTHGSDIYFNSGKFNKDSDEGKHLLAHELTHVMQQNPKTLRRKHVDVGMTISKHREDGFFQFDFGYQLEIKSSQALITINIRLVPDRGVTRAEVQKVKNDTRLEFLRYWDNRFTLRDPDGEIIPLRMQVKFVDSGNEELTVALHKGNSARRIVRGNTVTIINQTEDLQNWFVDSEPIVRAHELGHQLGMLDEYVDPASPNRTDEKSPGVFSDSSLMSNFGMDPDAADVKFRHGDRIAHDISEATRTEFLVGWSDTYIVRSRDTMKRIATRIYGIEQKWKDIYELNKSIIKNYTLKPGQVLKLPSRYS